MNAQKAFNPIPNGPQQTMSFNDLAGLVALFLWMDNGIAPFSQFPTAGEATPNPSISQVDAIQSLIDNGTLPSDSQKNKLFYNWKQITTHNAEIQQDLNDAQQAIGRAIVKIGNAWDGCSSVSLDMLVKIATMQ
jgi:hypothetical protein